MATVNAKNVMEAMAKCLVTVGAMYDKNSEGFDLEDTLEIAKSCLARVERDKVLQDREAVEKGFMGCVAACMMYVISMGD